MDGNKFTQNYRAHAVLSHAVSFISWPQQVFIELYERQRLHVYSQTDSFSARVSKLFDTVIA